ncbi:MAG: hypothetical protein DMG20_06460 [Acidobacteria bacterium]|nr:MAG: hypothetical protein DMG20_06460 [Acidobacteriota bacterium]
MGLFCFLARDIPTNVVLLLFDPLALEFPLFLLPPEALRSFFQVIGIVAAVVLNRCAGNFQNPSGNSIQKEAVVRDDDERFIGLSQEFFEPFN